MSELKLLMERELERLRKEVDDALQRLQAELPALCLDRPLTAAPIVIHDSGECFSLLMELPDLSPDDIDITVSREKIVISTKMERKEGPHVFYRYMRRRLFREIPLPREVDLEGISALFHDERLRIDIPWRHARVRRIAVESAEN
ncbi:MAG: Hsp20/alpha crystallin family protein [Deltaproteobacteria bacterium]